MATQAVLTSSPHQLGTIKPTTWLENILLFGIPAAAMYAAFYYISPVLAQSMPLGEARYVAGGIVMAGLILASLAGYILEGNQLNFSAFSTRFRINRMDKRTWLWTIGGLVGYILLAVAANTFVPLVYKALNFIPPIDTAEPWGTGAIPLVLFTLALNILGEELWWRGYILPRQELQFGKNAWVWNGVLWSFFHVFKWWTIPALLFVCLIVPFIAQRTRNTIPGMISHLVLNGLGIVIRIVQLLAM
jgi:hypothetical protein